MGAGQVWAGHPADQSSSCQAVRVWGDSQPQVERAPPSWWPGRAQKVAENLKPTCPRPGGRSSVCGLLLPGAATWPGYAHSRTYRAMYGGWEQHCTGHRHTELQAAVREVGPERSGEGRAPRQGHTRATWEQ